MEGAFRPGAVLLEKYRVESVLGRGGMGVVLRVTHLHLGEELAIKILSPEIAGDPNVRVRFLREAQSAVRLRGEHVTRISDVGMLPEGAPYIVMEYLRGGDLSAELGRRGMLPPGEVVDYVLQACEALAEAHALGIIHRDIKPSNLFLTYRSDGTLLVKVLDFGVSKAPSIGPGQLTRTDAVIGTPLYMSPEQMKAAKDVDVRTDIWALGIVLYECLNGRRPFDAESFSAVVLRVATEPPPAMDPRIPRELQAVVLRCLEKDPAARFQSMAELAVALAPFAHNEWAAGNLRPRAHPVAVPAPADPAQPRAPAEEMPQTGPARSPGRAHTLRVATGVLSALALLVIAGYAGWRIKRELDPVGPPREPPRSSSTSIANPVALPVVRHKLVVAVNNYGGAYPAVVANNGIVAGRDSQFAAAGLDVELRLILTPEDRAAAFDRGDIDIVLFSLDYLANQAPVFRDKGVELQAFLMADWSRGNLGIVATPRLTSIEDLKDVTVATSQNTSSHYLLLTLLEKSNLRPEQIDKVKLEFATNTEAAGDMFRRGDVNAAVVWEPYLSQAIAGGKGHVLVSTATASHLVSDVLCARADFLKEHEAEILKFMRTWFESVDRMKRDPQGSAQIIAGALGQSLDQTIDIMKKVKLTSVVDNREFFGLEKRHPPYLKLFEDASSLWQKTGLIRTPADGASTRWLKPLEVLAREHRDEKVEEVYQFDRCSTATSAPLLTKTVSVYFDFNDDTLTAEARNQVDSAAEILSVFGNACVRVVGHADSVGSAASIRWYSERRAAAVVDYLVSRGFQRARFQALGAGSDIRGDNATEAGRSMNRRTDFEIHINE